MPGRTHARSMRGRSCSGGSCSGWVGRGARGRRPAPRAPRPLGKCAPCAPRPRAPPPKWASWVTLQAGRDLTLCSPCGPSGTSDAADRLHQHQGPDLKAPRHPPMTSIDITRTQLQFYTFIDDNSATEQHTHVTDICSARCQEYREHRLID